MINIKELNEKYPYLNPANSGDWAYGNSDDICWIDNIDEGWFDLWIETCESINKILTDNNIPLTDFVIEQLKEKYGEIRCYFYIKNNNEKVYDELHELIDDCSEKSWHICSKCGKPATCYSTGYVLPFCDDCKVEGRKYMTALNFNLI